MDARIVFKWTIDLVLAKARKWVADKLQEGDVTDVWFRKFVVCQIEEIKSKLDGLARTNLLASICFLKKDWCTSTKCWTRKPSNKMAK